MWNQEEQCQIALMQQGINLGIQGTLKKQEPNKQIYSNFYQKKFLISSHYLAHSPSTSLIKNQILFIKIFYLKSFGIFHESFFLWSFFVILIISTIIFIIFWNFLMFYQIFLSTQVKGCTITTCTHDIYKLPHEFPNDLRLSILRN